MTVALPPYVVVSVEPDTFVIVDGPDYGRYLVARPLALRLGRDGQPDRVEYLDHEGHWSDLAAEHRFAVLDRESRIGMRDVRAMPVQEAAA